MNAKNFTLEQLHQWVSYCHIRGVKVYLTLNTLVLDRELKDTTRLIVAQRIGTIRNADKIIVLDEGRMVGMGTHEELMQTCPIYQEIARSQLSQEELGA